MDTGSGAAKSPHVMDVGAPAAAGFTILGLEGVYDRHDEESLQIAPSDGTPTQRGTGSLPRLYQALAADWNVLAPSPLEHEENIARVAFCTDTARWISPRQTDNRLRS